MSAADEIRRKQKTKLLLAEIVENLKDYFDEIQFKIFGKKSRFVVLNSIEAIHKIGSKGLNLVTAEFNSELGSLTLMIAIKKFGTEEEALKNKMLTENLIKQLSETDIATPRVIFMHGTTLIYEGIQGASFFDSNIDEPIKLRLAGEALAKYHSFQIGTLDSKRYVFLLKTVLQDLNIAQNQKLEFIDISVPLFEIILANSSGTRNFGDYHKGNILFSSEDDPLTKTKKIITWLIDPEYTEEGKADRMEDISTFFLHDAIEFFFQDKNLQRFRMKLIPFFEGYDRFLNQYGLSIYDIYKGNHELALRYHLGLNILLEALFLQKKANLNDEKIIKRWNTCISLTKYIWKVGIS